MSYSYRYDIFKYKKRLPIKSLQAAICNVALFKNMKEKQFRDNIYISYCQDGVILQTVSQQQWQRACDYVLDFLYDKKIALLTYGHEKDIYQQLIAKGLKEYTRRIKQLGEECPYINIIHYQKLRKSCQYMDKQKYTDPLRYWQSKFKTNPNFAFLIVQPKQRFHQVKRYLLQVLLKRQITLKIEYVSLYEFLYLFYNSKNKDQIRELCDKKIIQAQIIRKEDREGGGGSSGDIRAKIQGKSVSQLSMDCMRELQSRDYIVKLVNYSELCLSQYEIKIIRHTSNLAKLGLEYISSREIEKQIKTVVKYLRGPQLIDQQSQKRIPTVGEIYQQVHNALLMQIKQSHPHPQQQPTMSQLQSCNCQLLLYSMIPYRKCEKQKYLGLLSKLMKTTNEIKNKNLQEINNQLKKLQVCEYDQIEFLSMLPLVRNNSERKNQIVQEGEKISYNSSGGNNGNNDYDGCNVYKVSIDDCPYMVVQYHRVAMQDLDTFILYLQQLKTYYCSYLVRFYGIAIRYGQSIHQSHADILSHSNPNLLSLLQQTQQHTYKQLSKSKLQQYSYYLIFDYHHRSLESLIGNDFILDNLQIANIALQMLYLCQYLHQHDQPRCLGMVNFQQVYWPMAVVLPYLGHRVGLSSGHDSIITTTTKSTHSPRLSRFNFNYSQQGFEGDVKLIGRLIQHLMTADNNNNTNNNNSQQKNESFAYQQGTIDKQIQNLYKAMTRENKYDRMTIARAIGTLQDILAV